MKIRHALIAGLLTTTAVPSVHACEADAYIGSVCITAASFCPRQYMETLGQILNPDDGDYTPLFALIDNTFGGNGRTTFMLPDLRGRTAVDWGQGPGLDYVFMGQIRGREYVTLTQRELPSHTHAAALAGSSASLKVSSGSAETPDPTLSSYLASLTVPRGSTPPDLYTTDGSDLIPIQGLDLAGQITMGDTGYGQRFPIVPPQLGLRYCIAIEGQFPPRPSN